MIVWYCSVTRVCGSDDIDVSIDGDFLLWNIVSSDSDEHCDDGMWYWKLLLVFICC